MNVPQTAPSANRIPNIVFAILFVGILLGGILVRAYKLGDQSLWIDEGYSINAAQAVIDHGYPILDSGEAYNGHILSTYIIAGSMKLFGFDPYNPWSARLPAVIFGIGVMIMTYLLAYQISGSRLLGIGAMLFVAFLPWEIAWSRQARGYTMLQFFLLLSYNQLLLYIDKRNIWHGLILVLAFIGVCTSHSIGIIFLPVLLVTLGAAWIRAAKYTSYLSWIVGITLSLSIIVLAGIFLKGESFGNYFSSYGTYLLRSYPIIILFTLIGIIRFFFTRKKIEYAILMSSAIIIPFIGISFYTSIQLRYLLPIIPLLGIMATYGIFFLWNGIAHMQRERQGNTFIPEIVTILSICIIMVISGSFTILPRATYTLEFGSPQPNFKGAYEYISAHRQPGDIVISTYAHLTKIYFRETGILLPISLTGRRDPGYLITEQGRDYYTGAEVLNGVPDTLNMIENGHGYIIIDSMAKQRLGKFFTSITDNPKTSKGYESNPKSNLHAIWVYQF